METRLLDVAVQSRSRSRSRLLFGILAVILSIAGIYYIGRGTKYLLVGSDPIDLRRRWIDQQYFFKGQNPFDVMFKHVPNMDSMFHVPAWRNSEVDPAIGAEYGGGYPPWSFVSGALFVGLPYPQVRWGYAFFNLAALALIYCWAWRHGRVFGYAVAACFGAGAIATVAGMVTLAYGQYAIIVMGLIAASAWMDEIDRPWLSGLLLGISLLKPNISAPFCICFLVMGRFRTMIAVGGYLIVSSLIAWYVSKTNPLEMLQQMQITAASFVADMPSPIKLLTALGIPTPQAIQIVSGGGMLAGFALLLLIRRSKLLWQLAVASVIARLWCYHRPYDNLMIFPLIVALGVMAARRPTSWVNLTAFLSVGLTVWLPLSFNVKWPVVALQHLAWVYGMVVVFIAEYEANGTEDEVETETLQLAPALAQ